MLLQAAVKKIEEALQNTMFCPVKVNSITIELTVHTYCYCVVDYSLFQTQNKWTPMSA